MDLLDQLLERTSRTFALSIPLLPEPSRREVTLAYLLLRIADTLEDGIQLSPDRRQEALEQLLAVVSHVDVGGAEQWSRTWSATQPVDQPDYLRLLEEFPRVLECIGQLPSRSRQVILRHGERTIAGMRRTVQVMDTTGTLRLETVDQLREYCYIVAGIVGEMLTELFLLHWPTLQDEADRLRTLAPFFGEGLQLVNILKDADTDARAGRFYLPSHLQPNELFEIARNDLQLAQQYIEALQRGKAPKAVIAFTRLPVELAEPTLCRVEQCGPGSKLTRSEVSLVLDRVQTDLVLSDEAHG